MKSKVTLESEIRWPRRVVTFAEAVKYIDAVGYCMLFPVSNVPLASLYYAVARRNPHEKMVWDKYSMMVWRWKDELPRRRRAYYAKYFRGRGTLISLRQLPNFLALGDSALSPEDHERHYAEGRIGADARVIWEALAKHGPLATLELRHACKFDTTAGNRRYKKAMLELSRRLLVVHSGAEQETESWASSRFELTAQAFPDAALRARNITPEEARRMLAHKYIAWHRSADARTLARLFRWPRQQVAQAILPVRLSAATVTQPTRQPQRARGHS